MTATTKKSSAKKSSGKGKKQTAGRLPDPVVPVPVPVAEPQVLRRGQERLSDGRIRLKTGDHDLGSDLRLYEVHGVMLELSGKVMVASKDVDWLNIGQCQKCRAPRKGVKIRRFGETTCITFRCENENGCDIGGHTYIQIHSVGRLLFVE